jgi:hypothetical protein
LKLRPSGYEPDELPDCSTPRPGEKALGKETITAKADCSTGAAYRTRSNYTHGMW